MSLGEKYELNKTRTLPNLRNNKIILEYCNDGIMAIWTYNIALLLILQISFQLENMNYK